jgi:hypothetical protein
MLYLWASLRQPAGIQSPISWEEHLGQTSVEINSSDAMPEPESNQFMDAMIPTLTALFPNSLHFSGDRSDNPRECLSTGWYIIIFRLLERTQTPEELAGSST